MAGDYEYEYLITHRSRLYPCSRRRFQFVLYSCSTCALLAAASQCCAGTGAGAYGYSRLCASRLLRTFPVDHFHARTSSGHKNSPTGTVEYEYPQLGEATPQTCSLAQSVHARRLTGAPRASATRFVRIEGFYIPGHDRYETTLRG